MPRMYQTPRRVAFLFSLLLSTFVVTSQVSAAPFNKRILGGLFTDLTSSAIAYVEFNGGSCSGILVGRREVLTAGHCVLPSLSSSDYSVFLGGQWFNVESAYYHSNYIHGGNTILNGPFDLGMLILNRTVTTIRPFPVLYNYNVLKSDQVTIFGYGSNELSGDPGRDPLSNGKLAVTYIEDNTGGMLSSSHRVAGSSSCSGDSGGPMTQYYENRFVVVGVLSYGTNDYYNQYCYLAYGGNFSYVDLQSDSSQRFLGGFPGVEYINGNNIYINNVAKNSVTQIKKALKAKTKSDVAKTIKPTVKNITTSIKFSEGKRKFYLKSALKDLKAAPLSKNMSGAVTKLKSADSILKKLIKMGIS
jgi:hypothetical protein